MKKLFALMLLAAFMFGCNSEVKKENEELKAQLAAMAEQNAMLALGEMEMEMSIESYQAMLLEIDNDLATLDEKHAKVKELVAGDPEEVQEDIMLHLQHVHGSLASAKHKINNLHKNLDQLYKDENTDKMEIAVLEKQLDEATMEIMGKDVVIDALNQTVAEEGYEIAVLYEAYEEQAAVSEALYGILNTGYVIVGTKKELKEWGILENEEDFIGMGNVKALVTSMDYDWMMSIPIDQTDEIDLNCKKAKLLSSHPESSYELFGDKITESLVITDKLNFWGDSDIIVLEITRE